MFKILMSSLLLMTFVETQAHARNESGRIGERIGNLCSTNEW